MELFSSKPLRNKLKATAISCIWYSHAYAFSFSKKPYEPDHVASFIIIGLPKLTELWSEWLAQHGLGVQVTGVFCHQYPQVEFQMNGKPATVELADLLVVRRHYSGARIEKEVATLVQSKMSSDSSKNISASDPQYYLYKNWPEFNFKQREYSNHKRSIGLIKEQSKYSLICEGMLFPEDNSIWPDSCFWSIVDELEPNMESDDSFASFLEGMVAFERGREFFSQEQTGCEWTNTIRELLDITFKKRLKTRLYSAPKRGNHQYACLVTGKGKRPYVSEMTMFSGSGGGFAEEENEDSTPGIPTILIETFDIES